MKKGMLMIIPLLLFTIPAPIAQANLIQDPSFEYVAPAGGAIYDWFYGNIDVWAAPACKPKTEITLSI